VTFSSNVDSTGFDFRSWIFYAFATQIGAKDVVFWGLSMSSAPPSCLRRYLEMVEVLRRTPYHDANFRHVCRGQWKHVCHLNALLFSGAETRFPTRQLARNLDAFDQWSLRRILHISWRVHILNDEVSRCADQPPVLVSSFGGGEVVLRRTRPQMGP